MIDASGRRGLRFLSRTPPATTQPATTQPGPRPGPRPIPPTPLPGFLLLTGVLPFWNTFRTRPWAQALMRGANAAVVGILAAALYNPVFTTAITGPGPFVLALVCFVLLVSWRLPAWAVVLVGAAGGIVLSLAA